MEIVQRLHAVAAVLTSDGRLRQQLVREMAMYLAQTKPSVAGAAAPAGSQAPRKDADRDLFASLRLALPPRQRQVFDYLLTGVGIREIGRRLGISHVAVIKHREKILHRTRKFLQQPPLVLPPGGDSSTPPDSVGMPVASGSG